MLKKDITHPNMRRRIKDPRIIFLDCPLQYKKGESQTKMEFSKETDWARAQEIEEGQIEALCERLLAWFRILTFLRSCPARVREKQCFVHSTCQEDG